MDPKPADAQTPPATPAPTADAAQPTPVTEPVAVTPTPETTPAPAEEAAPAPETPAATETPAEAAPAETPAETPATDAAPAPETAAPAEGETPADPAAAPNTAIPPTAKADETNSDFPPAGKKKFLTKKRILLAGIVAIILIIAFLAFSFIRGKSQAKAAALQKAADASQQDASASAQPIGPITPECVSGYKPYVNKSFSICYPVSMSLKENDASSSGEVVKQYTFQDDVEVLNVQTDYKDNLNKSNCASTKVVQVAGFSAQRYAIKDTTKTGTCAQTINAYGLLVGAGNDKPVFYVGLSKKSGSYLSDNGEFDNIMQSFQINQ